MNILEPQIAEGNTERLHSSMNRLKLQMLRWKSEWIHTTLQRICRNHKLPIAWLGHSTDFSKNIREPHCCGNPERVYFTLIRIYWNHKFLMVTKSDFPFALPRHIADGSKEQFIHTSTNSPKPQTLYNIIQHCFKTHFEEYTGNILQAQKSQCIPRI